MWALYKTSALLLLQTQWHWYGFKACQGKHVRVETSCFWGILYFTICRVDLRVHMWGGRNKGQFDGATTMTEASCSGSENSGASGINGIKLRISIMSGRFRHFAQIFPSLDSVTAYKYLSSMTGALMTTIRNCYLQSLTESVLLRQVHPSVSICAFSFYPGISGWKAAKPLVCLNKSIFLFWLFPCC